MKKILFCIYIITACTYLRPVIAGTCEAVVITSGIGVMQTEEMLTTDGITADSSQAKLFSEFFLNKPIYVCNSILFGNANGKDCFINSYVFTTDDNGYWAVFKCKEARTALLTPYDKWEKINPTKNDLPLCKGSVPRDTTDSVYTIQDDLFAKKPKPTHGKLINPCFKFYCPDDKAHYDKTKNACVNAQVESNTAAATTTTTTDTAAATTTTTTDTAAATTTPPTTTATASEPRDEYADTIKKIEDEIQDYSKKCSKYTKDKSSSSGKKKTK